MSFILDALKKIERQKQAQEGPNDNLPVMEGGRRWGETRSRSSLIMAGAVAIALVALVLAGLALNEAYREGRSSNVDVRPTRTESAGGPADAGVEKLVSPEPSPPPTTPGGDAEATPAKPLAVVSEEPEEVETLIDEEPEVAHPVRLTGQGESGPTDPDLATGENALGPPPKGAPELELQGTSVVEGRPVAVVNFQRLFEGDTIEGVKVIRIMDRIVEMEFDGKRFVIAF